jgi:hypothetical protein
MKLGVVLVALVGLAGPLSSVPQTAAGAGTASSTHASAKTSTRGDFDGDGRSDIVSEAPRPRQANGDPYVRIDYTRAHPDGSHVQTLSPPIPKDRAFVAALAVGDFNGDGYDDLAVSGIHYHESTIEPSEVENGQVFIYSGSRNGLTTTPTVLAGPENGINMFGIALAAGDSNGDGYADLAVGDPATLQLTAPGTVSVFSGSATGLTSSSVQTLTSKRPNKHGWFGRALTFADVDGDGHADLVIGEPFAHQASNRTSGDVQVFDGTVHGLSSTTNDVVWGYKIRAGAGFGEVLAGGNIDGHRPADIVTTAAGGIVLLTGGKDDLSGTRSQRVGPSRLPHGLQDLEEFGESVAVADVTGDGRADVIVGAPESRNESGVVVVLPGGAGGLQPKRAEAITQGAAGIPGHVHSRNEFGASLTTLVLGPGKRHAVAIGTPGANLGMPWRGATFILHGDAEGLSTHHVRVILGAHDHDRLGQLVR